MRTRSLILMLCLGGSLLGCSSKPSASDIAAEVNKFWKRCVKISDVTKTNGVENGNTYRVSYTYNLEVLEDKSTCSMENNIALMKIFIGAGSGPDKPVKTGDVFTVTNETNMVKSEKGWVFQ